MAKHCKATEPARTMTWLPGAMQGQGTSSRLTCVPSSAIDSAISTLRRRRLARARQALYAWRHRERERGRELCWRGRKPASPGSYRRVPPPFVPCQANGASAGRRLAGSRWHAQMHGMVPYWYDMLGVERCGRMSVRAYGRMGRRVRSSERGERVGRGCQAHTRRSCASATQRCTAWCARSAAPALLCAPGGGASAASPPAAPQPSDAALRSCAACALSRIPLHAPSFRNSGGHTCAQGG